MKKLLAIVLSLLMVMSLAVPAMAEDVTNHTITITNTKKGVTYNAYKILDVQSYNGGTPTENSSASAVYTIASDSVWYQFVIDSDFLKIDVVTKDGVTTNFVTADPESSTSVADFAKAAMAFAKEHNITVTATGNKVPNVDGEEVVITVSELGYYLVDSSLGALCSLDTTTPNAFVHEKNDVPHVEKTVQEDSTGVYGEENDADIGSTVNYKITVTVPKDSSDSIRVIDKMSQELTFNNSVVVKIDDVPVSADNYTFVSAISNNLNALTPALESTEGVTFVIDFKQDYIKSINAAEKKIDIYYSGVINDDAVVSTEKKNEVDLKYGDEFEIDGDHDETKTYIYDFILKKHKNDGTLLEGAEFVLYRKEKNADDTDVTTKYAKFTTTDDITYRFAGWVDAEGEATPIKTKSVSRAKIEGLDASTYFLKETKTPQGYNPLKEDVKVTITAETKTSPTVVEYKPDTYNGDGFGGMSIQVLNQSGSELPETGGIGTTIFYVVGGLMMAVAVVLLVTKKKVNGK